MYWRNADVLEPFPRNAVEAALWEERRGMRRAHTLRVLTFVGWFALGLMLLTLAVV